MCGIVGFFNSKYNVENFPQIISDMLSMIKHRGPDEMGYYFNNSIAFGTARLSVIDLHFGQQPMADSTDRYWISYNGEIYNYIELRKELEQKGYSFKTNSDTEVIINSFVAWGVNSFEKLNGGFAFIIYDSLEDCIYLVRDRYGERPLFYTKIGEEFIFASEIKCFHAYKNIKLSFDEDNLQSLLLIWTPLPDNTVFKEVYQVMPGEYLVIKKGNNLLRKKYCSLNFKSTPFKGDITEATQTLKNLLEKSVRIRMRSDVEVGTYLSGGLDSSIITSIASKLQNNPIKTFSVSFTDDNFDESKEQKLISDKFCTHHTDLKISSDSITRNFLSALWHVEMPVFRTAFVPMYILSERVMKEGIKVVLTGEGSDEFFYGYDIFKETIIRRKIKMIQSIDEKLEKVRKIYPYLKHFQDNLINMVSLFEKYSDEKYKGLFSHEVRFNNSLFSTRLLNKGGNPYSKLIDFISKNFKEYEDLDSLQKSQFLECNTLLSGYLLSSQGDRMSFSHSVESRLPFLDYNVTNFANSLPLEFKLKNDNEEKHILKKSFLNDLPEQVLNRPKYPYRSPDAYPFFVSKPEYFDDLLALDNLKKNDYLNHVFSLQLIEKLKNLSKEKISQRENQTFTFLLSILLIQEKFINDPLHKPSSIEKLLVRKIDGRKLSLKS